MALVANRSQFQILQNHCNWCGRMRTRENLNWITENSVNRKIYYADVQKERKRDERRREGAKGAPRRNKRVRADTRRRSRWIPAIKRDSQRLSRNKGASWYSTRLLEGRARKMTRTFTVPSKSVKNTANEGPVLKIDRGVSCTSS